ncbi:MAG: PAS domain-containing sensor histidine kinase [Candidatus Rifleibacteriota bacterium]
MRTCFATPDRANTIDLEEDIKLVSDHPVIKEIIQAYSGVFAVCNEFRQILAVNATLLNTIGVKDPYSILGLRLGEALGCIHANKSEGGCGTTEYCSSCGAAIAMVASITKDKPVEKKCAISTNGIRQKADFYFNVRCSPFAFENHKFLLLTMQDLTRYKKLQCMERVFLHDLTNLATALSGLSDYALDCEKDDLPLIMKAINLTTTRLLQEIKIQKLLNSDNDESFLTESKELSLKEIFEETVDSISCSNHLRGKKLRKPEVLPDKVFRSDKTLIMKVLQNMLLNAFEATDPGRAVRFWVDCGKNGLTFCVWNHKEIDEKIKPRIFQRNYTTKDDPGRGLGTYSMKVFGEDYLGGKVYFESNADKGTVFKFRLPLVNSE